jgi:hypothetical protein
MAMRLSIFGSAKILRANFGSFTFISSIADPFPGHNRSLDSSAAKKYVLPGCHAGP